MPLRFLTCAASIFGLWLLMAGFAMAKSTPPHSLSSQSKAEPLPFFYPVQPADIALFGELQPPSSSRLQDQHCLDKGQWAMFWVPALTHVEIEVQSESPASKLKTLKISGPRRLQGILAFIDHATTPKGSRNHDLFNPDAKARAFLVSSPDSICLEVKIQGRATPDLAWTRAWRSYWNTRDPLELPPAAWFDKNPRHPARLEAFAQAHAMKELTERHPQSWPFARWLAALHRIKIARALQPSSIAQFGEEALSPLPRADFSDLSHPFALAEAQKPLAISVKGPGHFELRARVVAPANTPAVPSRPALRLQTDTRQMSFPPLLRPRANQGRVALGPVARKRFWIPKGEHHFSILAIHANMRLSLRKSQEPRRVSALLRNATPQRALRKARLELRKLKKDRPSLAKHLSFFLNPWDMKEARSEAALLAHSHLCRDSSPWLCAYSALNLAAQPTIPLAKRARAITKACQQFHGRSFNGLGPVAAQQYQAKLALALLDLKAKPEAAKCLGDQDTILSSDYLQASLDLQSSPSSSRSDVWIAAGLEWFKQRSPSLFLKRAYLRRRRTRTRLVSVTPDNATPSASLRWLAPHDPGTHTRPNQQFWTQVSLHDTHLIRPDQHYNGLGQVMRLLVAFPEGEPKATNNGKIQVTLDGQTQVIPADGRQRVLHWIVSSNAHQLRVVAPSGVEVFCDVPVQAQGSEVATRLTPRQYWSLSAKDAPLHFQLGEQPPLTSTSLKLRVQVSNRPDHRQTLPLTIRSNDSPPVGVWLHYDPQTVDPSLRFGDFPRSSFPISINLGAHAAPSQLWVVPNQHSPKLAVALAQRQSSVLPASPQKTSSNHVPTPEHLSAQGPLSLASRISRAKFFLQDADTARLRSELEWLLDYKDNELRGHRKPLLDLLSAISRRRQRKYFTLHQAAGCEAKATRIDNRHGKCPDHSSNFVLNAMFLDNSRVRDLVTARELEQSLRKSASKLDLQNIDSISEALSSIASYLHTDQSTYQNSSMDALTYGMLQEITKLIKGGAISAWLGQVARRTRWKNIEYASQSAGHEWLQLPGNSPETPSSNLPWQDPAHTLDLREHQQKVVRLARHRTSTLKIQSYCELNRPNDASNTTILDVWVNQDQHQQVDIPTGELTQTFISLQPGRTRLRFSLTRQQEQRCAIRVLEQSRPEETWVPVELIKTQRFFVANHKDPVTLQARGPGTMQIQIRGNDPLASNQPVFIKNQSPDGTNFTHPVQLPHQSDSFTKIKRSQERSSSEPVELSFLMSGKGIYRYQIQSSGPQYLVRAKTRVKAKHRPAKHRLTGVLHTLHQRLSEPGTPLKVAPGSLPPHRNAISRYTGTPHPKGIGELQAGGGLRSDLEYDQPNTRWTTQIHGAWLAAVYPHRLWIKGQLGLDSENRISPATRAQAKLYWSNRRSWIRGQLNLQWASQYLHRFAHGYGVSGRFEFSLRNLKRRPGAWDLLTGLRFSYRTFSKSASSIANSSINNALHRYIYRSYLQDHPFSVRPRLELVWRKFYDIRAYLGQDAWFNSDLKSIDRSRAWFTVSGLLDSFGPTKKHFLSYNTGYRFSYAFSDLHRTQGFTRSEFLFNIKATWRYSKTRLWELSADSAILTQSDQPVHLRFLLGARIAFDRFGPLLHRPIQTRRYPHEIKTRDWNAPEETP